MNIDPQLLNTLIQDFPNKSIISDGTFTLGQLHKDRLSLLVNWIDLLSVLYDAKGVKNIIWIAVRDNEGKTTKGHMHVGLFHKDKTLMMGAMVPLDLWDIYETKAEILMEAPKYKSLVETLPNYFYERLNNPEII